MGKVAELRIARERQTGQAGHDGKVKLTKRFVESVKPDTADIWLWDRELTGFGLRVKPSGVRTFLIQYRNQAGRTRRLALGRYGVLTPEEARRAARLRLAEVQSGGDPSADRRAERKAQTVAQLCDRYLADHAEIYKKPSSVREDRRLIEKRILPSLGSIKIDAVTRSEVIKLHSSLRETPYEANRTLSLLSKMLNLAEVWELRPEGSNPCRLVRRFREQTRKRFLSPAEMNSLGKVLKAEVQIGQIGTGAILAIQLLALTGCRLGEILSLRWENVDLEDGSFRLPDAKTGPRTVPMASATRDLLSRAEPRGPYVVTGADPSNPIPTSTVETVWRRIRDKAGLDARIHDLRHTVGTYAGQSGLNSFLVRDLLGHKTMAVTGRYVSPDMDPLRSAIDEVSGRVAALIFDEGGTSG